MPQGPGSASDVPQFESWNLDATLTVMGDDVVANFSAIHRTDRPADQGHNRCSTGGGGIDDTPTYTLDSLCASGHRASTGDCCDSMVHIRGVKWCVIVN